MTYYICQTCGIQFTESEAPPASCPICEDERQYVAWAGQQWTTLAALQATHHNRFETREPGLTGIVTVPRFAIGQRGLLIQTPEGNILWDCISLIDEMTITTIEALGGISAIAISHPHYYSTSVEWSRTFDAPLYLHAADQAWVMRPDPAIQVWEGDTHTLGEGLTLIRCGGHFAGGTVLHWADGAEGRGALLTGDILQVVEDRRYVSFMYSYPNYIPLPAKTVQGIVDLLDPFAYDRIYGAFWDKVIPTNAKENVAFSARRYINALEGVFNG
ncbi:MAG: MBL fold metallo-hydrolase [Chloroflexota bacterium]